MQLHSYVYLPTQVEFTHLVMLCNTFIYKFRPLATSPLQYWTIEL